MFFGAIFRAGIIVVRQDIFIYISQPFYRRMKYAHGGWFNDAGDYIQRAVETHVTFTACSLAAGVTSL